MMACPLGADVTPPASEMESVETPFTIEIVSVVEVDVSKLAVSVGVKIADRDTEPRDAGAVHEHVAVVEAAEADAHPEIVTPPNWKFTDPALETVAVIVTAPLAAAVVAEPGSAIDIVVVALFTVIVSAFTPTWLLPSLARTVCE